jgi:hypothetical protein
VQRMRSAFCLSALRTLTVPVPDHRPAKRAKGPSSANADCKTLQFSRAAAHASAVAQRNKRAKCERVTVEANYYLCHN